MPTQAISTQGIQLQRGDGGSPSETFDTIAEVKTLTGPTEKVKQIEVTSVDSTAHEYIAGLPDGGEVKITCNFIAGDDQQQGLRQDMADRVQRNFQLVLTDAEINPTTIAFTAIVIEFGIKGSVDKEIEAEISMKLSGPAEYTYHT